MEGSPETSGLPLNTSQRPDVSETMAFPGEADLQTLARLVETGQVTAIKEWATALKAHEPRYAVFSERVLAATKILDMEGLRELVDQSGPMLDK